MTTFFYHWNNIPDDFVGRCYCRLQAAYYWLGKNKVYDSGTEVWYKDGKHHRLNGPAISHKNNNQKLFFINDNQYYECEYWEHPLVIENKLKSILALEE